MRNLVGCWRVGQKLPRLGVAQILGRDPTHTLHKAADHLAAVYSGIDGLPDVDQEIDARHPYVAGEAIDSHLGHGTAVGVVKEGRSFARFPIKVHSRRGVGAAFAETGTLLVSQGNQFAETERDRWL